MSADAWTTCHNCHPDGDPYEDNDSTFREDYEIHSANEGTVVVDYFGWCIECGYGVNFTYSHDIPEKV